MNGNDVHTETVKERLSPRAKPQQNRSRARLEALLEAAEEVIAESGLQGLAMREVARRADLTIASVYHYFPSTAALIRALVERQLEKLRGILETGLRARFPMDAAGMSHEQVKALFAEQVGGLVDDVAAFFFNTPAVSEIWGGLQAYPDLRALDIEDTKKNAALIQPVFTRFIPSLEPVQASTMAMVLVESVSASLRLATALPPEAREQVVAALKSFVTQWLTGLLQTAEDMNAD
jgi:AcrR family transcriptional regulator